MNRRSTRSERLQKIFLVSAVAIGLQVASPAAYSDADVLLEFNFENFQLGQIQGAPSFQLSPRVSGSFDMANNGVENFATLSGHMSMTRFAGDVNYPELTITACEPVYVEALEFNHFHNHNPGFPTYPDYDVDLELDDGSGFVTVGTFLAEPGYDHDSFAGPGILPAGTYRYRWIPQVSPDTNTEFFALDNIRLSGDLVDLSNDDDGDGVANDLDLCPATVIPEAVATSGLGNNRWALTGVCGTFETTAPNGNGPDRSYTTADTMGCSCEQIVAELDLGEGHLKHGCSISVMDAWVELVQP